MEKFLRHTKKVAILWNYWLMTTNLLMQSKKQVNLPLYINLEDCVTLLDMNTMSKPNIVWNSTFSILCDGICTKRRKDLNYISLKIVFMSNNVTNNLLS